MSNAFELNASVRSDLGKGASRRLRRLNNNIPAIVYGGNQDPVSITIPHKDIIRAVANEAFFSHIITLNVDENSEQVIIKALQRHPAKPFILHADFLRVSADEEIEVNVPVHFLNEEKCKGVKLGGGSILHTLTEIEISCLPRHLPEYLEVDMADLDIGDSIHLSDIVFPEGVTCIALSRDDEDADQSIATVQAPRAEEEEVEVDAAGAEDGDADASDDGDDDDKSDDGE
jgi:large subunit ribosomal protein L25